MQSLNYVELQLEVVEPTITIPRLNIRANRFSRAQKLVPARLLCIFFCSGRVTIKAYVRPELLNI